MERDLARSWMWSEACAMMARAERLHREFFRPLHLAAPSPALPSWEPPVDLLETEGEILVFVALPGVSADRVEMTIEGAELVISGLRAWPAELKTAVIHRLELPQGRFERRVPLPAGKYAGLRRSLRDGCLVITLEKVR